MGKNMRSISSNISLQNKILHALDRRHRWQNVRRVLPNKRQGSGKHIIDGASSEPTANTTQPPPEPQLDPKKNKPPKNEQETADTRSKKFRIRSIISDEMAKRRGKHYWRRSSSPTRSPKKKSNSVKKTEIDPENGSRNRCESPSTTKKKRKCDICAAMLTVSYLRQRGLANEHMVIQDERQQPDEMLEGPDTRYLHSKIGLTKSLSFPLLASKKTKDFELQELKQKLRDFKDLQTTKDKFILPMNQWKDVEIPKPMLTRPASFRATCSTSRKEKKQPTNQSKTLKQRIGFVIKVDGRKEKRRILMDAVLDKIPYGGRKTLKDPKKGGPEKIKSTSTGSTSSYQSSGKKTLLKKTSSTGETMSKYRRLLSQTSTRDEKLHHHSGDHKPKLFVAGGHSSERKAHIRIRSLPAISPQDFTPNEEFPVKPPMDIHLSISGTLFDDQTSSDQFVYPERRNMPESIGKESKLIKEKEVVDEKQRTNTFDHQEKPNHKDESNAAVESGANQETSSSNKDEAIQENVRMGHGYQEQNDHQKQAVDEDLGVGLNSSSDQENTDNQKESRVVIQVENDKPFNEILGMFKKVSDERVKQNDENQCNGVVGKVGKNTAVEKVPDVHKNQNVNQNTMDHQENHKAGSEHSSGVPSQKTLENNEENTSLLSSSYEIDKPQSAREVRQNTLDKRKQKKSLNTSSSEIDWLMQDLTLGSSSLINIHNFPLEEYHVKKKQYVFSTKDLDEKRPNNDQMIKKGFLHLDLESVNDNAEFQFVKQVLDKSGFLKTQLLGEWYSSYQPIDPLLFEEVETSFLQTKILEELDSMKDEDVVQKIINDHHLLLFDLINEALLEIHSKTYTYCPHPLTYCSKMSPMPVGCRLLEEVWDIVSMHLSWKPELQPSLDDVVSRDLAKGNGWMNLQGDAEIVGIELEELLVDDLLDELVFDDLLM